eukprot:403372769
MKIVISTAVALFLYSSMMVLESAAKDLKPFCGVRPLYIRTCEVDDDCQYSDEICKSADDGFKWCAIEQSLYDNDPCNEQNQVEGEDWFDQNTGEVNWDNIPQDPCMTVRCSAGYTCCGGICHPNTLEVLSDLVKP